MARDRLPRVSAPEAGTYAGTVDSFHAIFEVGGGALPFVRAIWFRPSRNRKGWIYEQDAWDVRDGVFRPSVDRRPVKVRIRRASRITPE